MAKRLQLRRGTTEENNAFTGALGEVSVDTDKDMLVVHDGVTVGGFPVAARANANGTISLIKKDGTIIGTINATGLFNNTLTSTNTDQALTAAQGKALQDNKLEVTAAFAVGQTWTNVSGSRVAGTTYTNSTGKPIQVYAELTSASTGVVALEAYASVGGVVVDRDTLYSSSNTYKLGLSFVVPSGATYSINIVSNVTLTYVSELR